MEGREDGNNSEGEGRVDKKREIATEGRGKGRTQGGREGGREGGRQGRTGERMGEYGWQVGRAGLE